MGSPEPAESFSLTAPVEPAPLTCVRTCGPLQSTPFLSAPAGSKQALRTEHYFGSKSKMKPLMLKPKKLTAC